MFQNCKLIQLCHNKFQKLSKWIKKNVPYQSIRKGEYVVKEYTNNELIELEKSRMYFYGINILPSGQQGGNMQEFTNNITAQYNEISKEDIEIIEKTYNFKFPNEIKNFYLAYNAGKLQKTLWILNEMEFEFQDFYSIKIGYSTLNKKLELNYNDDWWPKWLIPFGYDGGGNSFCFSKENGKIYYVFEDDEDESGNVPVQLLNNNFIEFINYMVKDE